MSTSNDHTRPRRRWLPLIILPGLVVLIFAGSSVHVGHVSNALSSNLHRGAAMASGRPGEAQLAELSRLQDDTVDRDRAKYPDD